MRRPLLAGYVCINTKARIFCEESGEETSRELYRPAL